MSGDCPECGQSLVWRGQSWSAHSDTYHARTRRRLLWAVARLLVQQAELDEWLEELDASELVGFRWRNGVYPGWQLEDRWGIPREWWADLDEQEKLHTLKVMRQHLTELLMEKHGIEVNQATWFHKIYRQTANES